MQKITPHLWFDKEAREAAEFYTSVFPESKIKDATTLHNTPSGTVDILTVALLGQDFVLLSAGPLFKFNEAISFISPLRYAGGNRLLLGEALRRTGS